MLAADLDGADLQLEKTWCWLLQSCCQVPHSCTRLSHQQGRSHRDSACGTPASLVDGLAVLWDDQLGRGHDQLRCSGLQQCLGGQMLVGGGVMAALPWPPACTPGACRFSAAWLHTPCGCVRLQAGASGPCCWQRWCAFLLMAPLLLPGEVAPRRRSENVHDRVERKQSLLRWRRIERTFTLSLCYLLGSKSEL